ncbi:MAG: sarcosine oxidase subunit delta [Gammaproteobacteria bacterium]|nr:sarcosine oxidase subunit delta [Gammaproteobacteria bacterium]MBV9695989.1 sarcosine oxidase subunit delta [Gammaproteobacteria bacterium]
MMQLPCPFCGMRDESEFVCGGASHIERPPLAASDETWGAYLFFRDNPKGALHERWRHVYGCGQWFNLTRDTLTHQVLAVYRMGEPSPAGG